MFYWPKVSPNPATFVLQKYSEELNFCPCSKSWLYVIINIGQKDKNFTHESREQKDKFSPGKCFPAIQCVNTVTLLIFGTIINIFILIK